MKKYALVLAFYVLITACVPQTNTTPSSDTLEREWLSSNCYDDGSGTTWRKDTILVDRNNDYYEGYKAYINDTCTTPHNYAHGQTFDLNHIGYISNIREDNFEPTVTVYDISTRKASGGDFNKFALLRIEDDGSLSRFVWDVGTGFPEKIETYQQTDYTPAQQALPEGFGGTPYYRDCTNWFHVVEGWKSYREVFLFGLDGRYTIGRIDWSLDDCEFGTGSITNENMNYINTDRGQYLFDSKMVNEGYTDYVYSADRSSFELNVRLYNNHVLIDNIPYWKTARMP